jgi:hypothetical protein
LELKEWSSDMDGKILPAQLKLHEAIVQGHISDVQGRCGPPGSKGRIAEILRDSEFTLLVTLHGTLTVHPPHKRLKFIEKYKIDPDNWVREIDFDRDEGEREFLTPCQGRPHLRLVSEARSGEIEAPARPPAAPTPEAGTGSEEPPPEVPKLSGKSWVSKAYARRPDELHAMGITGASKALAGESKTAADCAKPLTARYIEKLLRELAVFPKAPRGSPK